MHEMFLSSAGIHNFANWIWDWFAEKIIFFKNNGRRILCQGQAGAFTLERTPSPLVARRKES